MKDFGLIMRELRRVSGLSQKEVADRISALGIPVNNAHVSRWESGTNLPSIEQFIGICSLFHITNVLDVFDSGRFSERFIQGLSSDGIQRLTEFRELLLHNEPYSTNPGVFVSKPVEYPDALKPDRGEKTSDPLVPFPCYNLGLADPFSEQNKRETMVRESLTSEADYAVVVAGTSMDPLFEAGSIALVNTGGSPRLGEVGLFRVNGNYYMRKLRRARGTTMLGAVNRAYQPLMIGPDDSFETIGTVLDADISRSVRVPAVWDY